MIEQNKQLLEDLTKVGNLCTRILLDLDESLQPDAYKWSMEACKITNRLRIQAYEELSGNTHQDGSL